MRSIEEIKIALNVAESDAAHRGLINQLLLELWTELEILQKNSTLNFDGSEKQTRIKPRYRNIDYEASIMDMPLSNRTKKCLASVDITCLEDLEGWTAYDLKSIRNMGLLGIREIGAFMAEKGMHLPGLNTIKRS
jgi:DNA-directed RNA polymerase alpha subunit